MKQALLALLSRFPKLKRALSRLRRRYANSGSVSHGYRPIPKSNIHQESARLRSSWQSQDLPARQRKLVNQQLADYTRGVAIDVFDVLVGALRTINPAGRPMTLLEVGCASGFYGEVLKIKQMPVIYSGCDYSPAFIELGKRYYPEMPLYVEDATQMSFKDASFDVVVSGCCLLHIPGFEQAVAETARTCREYAIFHRTPVHTNRPHQYFQKQAYGVETVEIHFNEEDLLHLFLQYGLECLHTYTLSQESDPDDPSVIHYTRTYVCRKIAHAII